jgi:hypothetical protein
MATRTDTFDRANSTNLGSDWSEDSGDWAINNNNLVQGTTGNAYRKVRWVGAAMDSNNYSVEVIARSEGGSQGIGPAARCSANTNVTYYSYMIFGSDRAYLLLIQNGSETILATGSTVAANTNYTLRIEVEGNTIRGYLNGTLDVSATDNTLTSGPPGVAAYGGTTTNSTYITTWTASDLGGAYAQSVAGVITPSGLILRRPNKRLAGALTPSGVLIRFISNIQNGSLTFVGTLVRQTNKNIFGNLEFIGSLVRQTLKRANGVLTSSGILTTLLVFSAFLSGTLSTTGNLIRQTGKNIAGNIGTTGLLVRRIGKLLMGILTSAGSVVRTLISANVNKADVDLTDIASVNVVLTNVATYTLVVEDGNTINVILRDEA